MLLAGHARAEHRQLAIQSCFMGLQVTGAPAVAPEVDSFLCVRHGILVRHSRRQSAAPARPRQRGAESRIARREELRQRLGLMGWGKMPLGGVVSRLPAQKGTARRRCSRTTLVGWCPCLCPALLTALQSVRNPCWISGSCQVDVVNEPAGRPQQHTASLQRHAACPELSIEGQHRPLSYSKRWCSIESAGWLGPCCDPPSICAGHTVTPCSCSPVGIAE